MKKKDWILMGAVVCAALFMLLAHMLTGGKDSGQVTVKVDGVVRGTYDLSKDQEIEINGGTNILQIREGKADMIEADCPDQICVHQKAVSRNHESIICLPNKVVVEVESKDDREYDAVAN